MSVDKEDYSGGPVFDSQSRLLGIFRDTGPQDASIVNVVQYALSDDAPSGRYPISTPNALAAMTVHHSRFFVDDRKNGGGIVLTEDLVRLRERLQFWKSPTRSRSLIHAAHGPERPLVAGNRPVATYFWT
jgi:hypothetical protein